MEQTQHLLPETITRDEDPTQHIVNEESPALNLNETPWTQSQNEESGYTADESHLDDVNSDYYESAPEEEDPTMGGIIGPDGLLTEEGQAIFFKNGFQMASMMLKSNALAEASASEECAQFAGAVNRLARQYKYTTFLCKPMSQNMVDALSIGSFMYGTIRAVGEEKRLARQEREKAEAEAREKAGVKPRAEESAAQVASDGTELNGDPYPWA